MMTHLSSVNYNCYANSTSKPITRQTNTSLMIIEQEYLKARKSKINTDKKKMVATFPQFCISNGFKSFMFGASLDTKLLFFAVLRSSYSSYFLRFYVSSCSATNKIQCIRFKLVNMKLFSDCGSMHVLFWHRSVRFYHFHPRTAAYNRRLPLLPTNTESETCFYN